LLTWFKFGACCIQVLRAQVHDLSATSDLIEALEHKFSTQDNMNTTIIILQSIWVQQNVKQNFLAQLNILKAYYCFEKIIGPKQVFITPLFDEALLVQLNHICQFP
jgi:hypothetical protein